MGFAELFLTHTRAMPAQDISAHQQDLQRAFLECVRQSKLHLWTAGDPIFQNGIRLLIGVDVLGNYRDMQLLDAIQDILSDETGDFRVDIFDALSISRKEELARYFPDPSGLLQTPYLGVWVDGVLNQVCSGFHARQLVLELVQRPSGGGY